MSEGQSWESECKLCDEIRGLEEKTSVEDEMMQNKKWVEEIGPGGMRSHREGKWEMVSGSPGDVQMP